DQVPVEMAVLFAPMDVVLSEDTVLQPDILVVPESSIGRVIETVPRLAIEVLSPSTRRIDLMLKRSRYEAAGTASYLVVDPDEPSIHAWVLDDDGRYAQAGAIRGEESLQLSRPFDLTLTPPPGLGGDAYTDV
ncbi:MAG: Uma2 family endonuclease, partial [Actinomycetales bacterium]